MSPTDAHDLTDDAVERALHADAEQWRVSHAVPSLDDAVRRLVAEDGAPARRRTGWWRPLAVAAAVLLLIGGAVTVMGVRRQTPPPPASTTTAEPAQFSAGTLTVPGGFVEASGHVVSPADAIIGAVLPRAAAYGGAFVGQQARDRDVERAHARVPHPHGDRPGRQAATGVEASPPTVDSSVWPDGSVTTVTWVAGGRDLTLVYSGPVRERRKAGPSPRQEVVAIAQTYQLGSSSTVSSPVHPAVPVTVAAGSSTLVLEETRTFSARRGTGGELLVGLRGGPSTNPLTANHCNPYEQAVLTGATATTVSVTVGVYWPVTGRDRPCTLESYAGRWVPVPLDGPLGARTVVDGATGKPVSLAGS